MKTCNSCKQSKLKILFSKNKKSSDGHCGMCKECHNKYYAGLGEEHKQGVKDRAGLWRRDNPVKFLLCAAKNRAKKLEVPFSLTEEDIHIPTHCPILGIELMYGGTGVSKKGYGAAPNAASIDRIDGSKGYIKGNVSIISWKANRAKCNLSVDEIFKLAEYFSWLIEE